MSFKAFLVTSINYAVERKTKLRGLIYRFIFCGRVAYETGLQRSI